MASQLLTVKKRVLTSEYISSPTHTGFCDVVRSSTLSFSLPSDEITKSAHDKSYTALLYYQRINQIHCTYLLITF